jgi:hypothetical protein
MPSIVSLDVTALRAGLARARGRLLAGALCVLLAACGGSSSGSANAGSGTANPAADVANSAAAGAGGASAAVAIVALPTSGACAAEGASAVQAPLLNTQLSCAP